jgi:hypothetical protein
MYKGWCAFRLVEFYILTFLIPFHHAAQRTRRESYLHYLRQSYSSRSRYACTLTSLVEHVRYPFYILTHAHSLFPSLHCRCSIRCRSFWHLRCYWLEWERGGSASFLAFRIYIMLSYWLSLSIHLEWKRYDLSSLTLNQSLVARQLAG